MISNADLTKISRAGLRILRKNGNKIQQYSEHMGWITQSSHEDWATLKLALGHLDNKKTVYVGEVLP